MSINSMERYYRNKGGKGKKELSNSPEKKPDSTPRSSKIKLLLSRALVGAGVIAITAVGASELLDNGPKRKIADAGLSPAMANDPEVFNYAFDHTAWEIRIFADNLARNRALMFNNNANNMEEMKVDLNTPMEDAQADVAAEVSVEKLPLETVVDGVDGVYIFHAPQDMEMTDHSFMKNLQASLEELLGSKVDINQIFVAVTDDANGITRIFMNSTIDNYKAKNGEFDAFAGDDVYVATDGQALNTLLDAQGVAHETFGLP